MLRALIPLGAGVIWLLVATVLMGFLPTRFPPPDIVLIVVVSFGFQYNLPLGGGLFFARYAPRCAVRWCDGPQCPF